MIQPMGSPGLRPLRVGEILDAGVKLYQRSFAALICAVAIPVVPVEILAVFVQSSASSDFGLTETTDRFGQTDFTFDAGGFWVSLAAILVTTILSFVAGSLASGACCKLVAGSYLGEAADWRDSLRFARSRLGGLIGLALLAALLNGLAFLAFIVPGVYLYAAWSVATPALLLEGRAPGDSLRRSRELVRDRWWPTAGVVLLTFLLTTVVVGVLSFGLLLPFGGFDDDPGLAGTLASGVVNVVASLLVTPFTAAVFIVLYVDLRVRKEGFDLHLLAQGIGSTVPAGLAAGIGDIPPPPPAPPRHHDIPPPPPPPPYGSP